MEEKFQEIIIPPPSEKTSVGRRLIQKNGKYNVVRKTESSLTEKYIRDFSNTLVSGKWWKIILASSSVFILCWLTFAVVWMLISTSNGDLEEDPVNPCIEGVKNFAGYFLFSLETQVSIGYGTRSITDQCLEGVFVICLQLIIGIFMCGVTVNLVYTKIVKPSSRFRQHLFSKHAVVCRRDGDLCLIFRVRDEEQRHAVGTTITAYILRKDVTTGEPYLEVLSLEPYGFLLWPLEIVHRITPKSPLWDISSYNLISDKFEIIVTLQGSSATTGQCSKARTSYVSSEILWGYKFKNCIRYNKKEAMYDVQRKNFNKTLEYATHLCSAKKFQEVYSSMTSTPTVSRNYNLRINVTYDGTSRRGTIISVESENPNQNERNREEERALGILEEQREAERELHRRNNASNFNDFAFHQTPIISNRDDSWMKESKSMPLIRDETHNYANLNGSKNYSSYTDYLARSKIENARNQRTKSDDKHRIFDEEPLLYESTYHHSLTSIDYPKSETEHEPEVDLNAMISDFEDYLDRNSVVSNSSVSLFPKVI